MPFDHSKEELVFSANVCVHCAGIKSEHPAIPELLICQCKAVEEPNVD